MGRHTRQQEAQIFDSHEDLMDRLGNTPTDTVNSAIQASTDAEEALGNYNANHDVANFRKSLAAQAEEMGVSEQQIQSEMKLGGKAEGMYQQFGQMLAENPEVAQLYGDAMTSVQEAGKQWAAAGADCRDTGFGAYKTAGMNMNQVYAQHGVEQALGDAPSPAGENGLDHHVQAMPQMAMAGLRKGLNVAPAPQVQPTLGNDMNVNVDLKNQQQQSMRQQKMGVSRNGPGGTPGGGM